MTAIAYFDDEGIPRAADGSVVINIGAPASSGGTGSYPSFVYQGGVSFEIPTITVTGQRANMDLGQRAGAFNLPGLGAFVTNLSNMLKIPEWLIVALAGAAAFYAISKIDHGILRAA